MATTRNYREEATRHLEAHGFSVTSHRHHRNVRPAACRFLTDLAMDVHYMAEGSSRKVRRYVRQARDKFHQHNDREDGHRTHE